MLKYVGFTVRTMCSRTERTEHYENDETGRVEGFTQPVTNSQLHAIVLVANRDQRMRKVKIELTTTGFKVWELERGK